MIFDVDSIKKFEIKPNIPVGLHCDCGASRFAICSGEEDGNKIIAARCGCGAIYIIAEHIKEPPTTVPQQPLTGSQGSTQITAKCKGCDHVQNDWIAGKLVCPFAECRR